MSRVAHSADSHGHGHAAAAVPAGEVRLAREKFLRLPGDVAARLTPSPAPPLCSPWSSCPTPRQAARTAASGGGTTSSAFRRRNRCAGVRASADSSVARVILVRVRRLTLSSLSLSLSLFSQAAAPGRAVAGHDGGADGPFCVRGDGVPPAARACVHSSRQRSLCARWPRLASSSAAAATAASHAARPPARARSPLAGYLLFVGCIEAKPGAEPKHACEFDSCASNRITPLPLFHRAPLRFPRARRPVPGEQVSGVAIGRGVGRGR